MGEEFTALDLQRMFVGEGSPWFLLEVAFRTTFMFTFTLLLVRTAGKRGIGDLTPFELLLVVTLGSAVGDPMFYPEVPLLHAMVVISVLLLLQRMATEVVNRSTRAEGFLESTTTCLVLDGVVDLKALRSEHFARRELFMMLRESGVEQLGQVRRAYLEPSGRVSAWLFRKEDVEPGLSLLPEDDPEYPAKFSVGERVPSAMPIACYACGEVLDAAEGFPIGQCANCDLDEGWLAASTERGGDNLEAGGTGRRRRHRTFGG